MLESKEASMEWKKMDEAASVKARVAISWQGVCGWHDILHDCKIINVIYYSYLWSCERSVLHIATKYIKTNMINDSSPWQCEDPYSSCHTVYEKLKDKLAYPSYNPNLLTCELSTLT